MRSLIFKAALAALLISTPLGSTFAAPGHGGGHGGGRQAQGAGSGHAPGSGSGGSATELDQEYADMYANMYGVPVTTSAIGAEPAPWTRHHHRYHHHPVYRSHGTTGTVHNY